MLCAWTVYGWLNICNSLGCCCCFLLVVVVMGDGASASVVSSCGNVSVMVLILLVLGRLDRRLFSEIMRRFLRSQDENDLCTCTKAIHSSFFDPAPVRAYLFLHFLLFCFFPFFRFFSFSFPFFPFCSFHLFFLSVFSFRSFLPSVFSLSFLSSLLCLLSCGRHELDSVQDWI